MTPRVWIERPIESVEDAEALPVGTIVMDLYGGGQIHYTRGPDGYATSDELRYPLGPEIKDGGVVTLVPVDATVEELPIGRRPGRRLCTAWEDL